MSAPSDTDWSVYKLIPGRDVQFVHAVKVPDAFFFWGGGIHDMVHAPPGGPRDRMQQAAQEKQGIDRDP